MALVPSPFDSVQKIDDKSPNRSPDKETYIEIENITGHLADYKL